MYTTEMEEKSTRGKVRACSQCGTTLASQIKFALLSLGWSLHIYCRNPDCNSDETILLDLKPFVTVLGIFIALGLIFTMYHQLYALNITCRNTFRRTIAGHVAAQNLFDSNRMRYAELDGDNDNKACE